MWEKCCLFAGLCHSILSNKKLQAISFTSVKDFTLLYNSTGNEMPGIIVALIVTNPNTTSTLFALIP